MEKYRSRQLVTQVKIEPNFGADLVSLFTNGINHVPYQMVYGSPLILQDQKHRELEAKHWFSMYFDNCGCVKGYASNSMIYG